MSSKFNLDRFAGMTATQAEAFIVDAAAQLEPDEESVLSRPDRLESLLSPDTARDSNSNSADQP